MKLLILIAVFSSNLLASNVQTPPLPEIIALQGFNGKWVAAEQGGGSYLVANRPQIGPWETYRILCYAKTCSEISLQTSNGHWVSAQDDDGKFELIGSRARKGSAERFILEMHPNHQFALKTHAGSYLTVDEQQGGKIVVAPFSAAALFNSKDSAERPSFVPAPQKPQDPAIVEYARRSEWREVNLYEGDVNAVASNGDTALSIALPIVHWAKREFERPDEGSDGVYYGNVKDAVYNLLAKGAKFSMAEENSIRQLNDRSLNNLLHSLVPPKIPSVIEISLGGHQKLPSGNWQVQFYDKANDVKQISPLTLKENISVPDTAAGFKIELNKEVEVSMPFGETRTKKIVYVLNVTELIVCSHTVTPSSQRKASHEKSYITFVPGKMAEEMVFLIEGSSELRWDPIPWNQPKVLLFGGKRSNAPSKDTPMTERYYSKVLDLTQEISLNGAFDSTVTIDCKKMGLKYSLIEKKPTMEDQGEL